MTIHHERFVYNSDSENSHKFWEYDYDDVGRILVVRWGRIGTAGQSKTFREQSPMDVQNRAATKMAKGYKKEGPTTKGGSAVTARATRMLPANYRHESYVKARRQDAIQANVDLGRLGFTIVQSYSYVWYALPEYEDCVEVAAIPNANLKELAEEFGVVLETFEEAVRLCDLLNTAATPGPGQKYGYPGEFSTIHVDGARLATG